MERTRSVCILYCALQAKSRWLTFCSQALYDINCLVSEKVTSASNELVE